MSWIVSISHWTQPKFYEIASKTNRIQFISINLSHYVEFARWSLQLQGVKFDEYSCLPGSHILPVLSVRVDRKGNKYLSNSSKPETVKTETEIKTKTDAFTEENRSSSSSANSSVTDNKKPKKGGITAVPIAVLPNGKLLLDSWEIAEYSGLTPIDADFKKVLDEEVGPLARQYAYSYVLKPANKEVFHTMFTHGKGILFKLFWWLWFGNFMKSKLVSMFKPYDVQTVEKCKASLQEVIHRIDQILLTKKTKYLSGSNEKPGVADLALASLTATLVYPKGYANGTIDLAMEIMAKTDPSFLEDLKYWRNTEVGKFTLKLYEDFRMVKDKPQ